MNIQQKINITHAIQIVAIILALAMLWFKVLPNGWTVVALLLIATPITCGMWVWRQLLEQKLADQQFQEQIDSIVSLFNDTKLNAVFTFEARDCGLLLEVLKAIQGRYTKFRVTDQDRFSLIRIA